MCTVTWLRTAGGYELFCNRDERKSRPAAWGPSVREARGVRFIAPTDALHGGSWLGVNQFGVTLSLLNRYDAAPQADTRDYLSRGMVLTDLLTCSELAEVAARLTQRTLALFQPFTLVALQPDGDAQLHHWNGTQLESTVTASSFISSSFYDTANVIAQRGALFEQWCAPADAAALQRFHHSHEPLAPAAAVCMHRADAQTVSFSHVTVTPTRITFAYTPHAPCQTATNDSYAIRLEPVTYRS